MSSDDSITDPKALKFEWLDAVMSNQGPASPMTRFVLQTMARWCSRQLDYFWVAQSTLVEQTGLSEATVRRRIQAAIAEGWLERLERGHSLGREGGGVASTYQLKIPDSVTGNSLVHRPVTESGNSESTEELPDSASQKTRHSDRPHRDTHTSRYSREHEGSPSQSRVNGTDGHLGDLQKMERAVAIGNQSEVTCEDVAELELIAEAGGRAATIAKAQLRNIEGRESC